MYNIKAGKNRVIKISDIIGVFDMDSATVSGDTKKYLRAAEKEGRTENTGEGLPKSFLLVKETDGLLPGKEKTRILFSQLSTATLKARIKEK